MADELKPGEDYLQVYIGHKPMIDAFNEWVRRQGWHLQGPHRFGDDDTPTHFLQPMSSPEALGAVLRVLDKADIPPVQDTDGDGQPT